MSDRDDSEDSIQNPETRSRRAWVECALQGVRRRLEAGEALPRVDSLAEAPPRPQLSLVPSGRQR